MTLFLLEYLMTDSTQPAQPTQATSTVPESSIHFEVNLDLWDVVISVILLSVVMPLVRLVNSVVKG